jgi:two-component system OmpR family response regulator
MVLCRTGIAVRILVVEDNSRVAESVANALRSAGHVVRLSASCEAAREAWLQEAFELAIVDIGLPDGSGLELCREARAAALDMPMLVLTARTGVDDRVNGLDAGADDYLGKPFAEAELLARVRALGRRGPHWTESARDFGVVRIDRDRRLVTVGGERIPLTAREFEIVAMLAWRDGRVVSKEDILETVWGSASETGCASLEVLVTRVRRKLSVPGVEGVIRTVRQAGYAWALARSKHS